jgi:2-amino-4-hydroxy-6-hydroxymethyldihydropteridine diphosphokinase
MSKTYLLLGSNLGNSQKQLEVARKHISKKMGEILRSSSFYCTSAWGNTNQPDFLNQVIIINNKLCPEDSMATILDIETKMGRIRTEKNAPRIIDIDILFYNKKIINTKNLTIPHPLMQERNFVMLPLNELSPNFVHPVLKKNIHTLFLTCKDKLAVNKI